MDSIQLKAYRGPSGIFLAWWHPTKVAGCLGYAVLRRADYGEVEPLLGYVSFAEPGKPVQANEAGQPSTHWSYQRFTWTDFEPPPAQVLQYRIVAVSGTADNPQQSGLVSDWVTPRTPQFGDAVPYFNFGIVGSRWFSKMAEEYKPEFAALREALAPQPKGPRAKQLIMAPVQTKLYQLSLRSILKPRPAILRCHRKAARHRQLAMP